MEKQSKELIHQRDELVKRLELAEMSTSNWTEDKAKYQDTCKSLANFDMRLSKVVKLLYLKSKVSLPEKESEARAGPSGKSSIDGLSHGTGTVTEQDNLTRHHISLSLSLSLSLPKISCMLTLVQV